MRSTANSAPWARFDDLCAGAALLFPAPDRVAVATRTEQVAEVLQDVHDATAHGAWAYGFVSYEAAPGLDPSLPGECLPGQPPLVWFGLCPEPARTEPVTPAASSARKTIPWRSDWTPAAHARAVATTRNHIAAGDIYQCNVTDRLRTPNAGDPQQLYAANALSQLGAYNAHLDTGRHVIVSASPELFFEWSGDEITTRPMKGTAARGRTTTEDEHQARRLLESDKDRAENLMLVDLLRNDLSRIAETGSVAVRELFTVERYPTVWQLTSQVNARTRPDVGLVDIFRALFPCGSVTGAPKQRAMQIIANLEPTPRGVYCGAIGVVAPPTEPTRARFSVAIRTAVIDRRSGAAVYGTGGAITWASTATAEWSEMRAKAAILTYSPEDYQLIETFALDPHRGPINYARHLARLADSACYFGFPFDGRSCTSQLQQALQGQSQPRRVQLLLSRSGEVAIGLANLPEPTARPVHLAVDDEPVNSASLWLRHKTTRREPYRSRAGRHPGAHDVVLINERGDVTETTIANLEVFSPGWSL